jgi:hypothetical protein
MDTCQTGRDRIVVTFTTLPDRYNCLLNSINSILQQTIPVDHIYVAIPQRCKRLDKEYPPIPKEISDVCTIITPETDYGPITKIYGGLISETDPDTIIISCDDDVKYHPQFVQKITEYARKHPNATICGTGALISRGLYFLSINTTLSQFRRWNWLIGFDIDKDNGRNVDLIFGVAGVLYRRKFFPSNDTIHQELFNLSTSNDALFHNDDVVISGYLSKNNVKRKVFYDIPSVVVSASGKDALSSDMFRMIGRLQESIQYAKTQGLFPTMEPLPVEETIPGRVVLLLFIIIIIIVFIILLYRTL